MKIYIWPLRQLFIVSKAGFGSEGSLLLAMVTGFLGGFGILTFMLWEESSRAIGTALFLCYLLGVQAWFASSATTKLPAKAGILGLFWACPIALWGNVLPPQILFGRTVSGHILATVTGFAILMIFNVFGWRQGRKDIQREVNNDWRFKS